MHLTEVRVAVPCFDCILAVVWLLVVCVFSSWCRCDLVCDGHYPHAFLKKRRGYCYRLRASVGPSVMLTPPKPLDDIQPNFVYEVLT